MLSALSITLVTASIRIWKRPQSGSSVLPNRVTGTQVPMDTRRMHYEALTLKGAFHFTPSDVRIALDLILRGALPLDTLVTGEVGLDRLEEAFGAMIRGECIKLAILPDGVL